MSAELERRVADLERDVRDLERDKRELRRELADAEKMLAEAEEERDSLRHEVRDYETSGRAAESARREALVHAARLLASLNIEHPYEKVMTERAVEAIEELIT